LGFIVLQVRVQHKNVATHPDTANDHNLAHVNDLSTDEKAKRQKYRKTPFTV